MSSQPTDHREPQAPQVSMQHREPTIDSGAFKAAKLASAVQILATNPAITGNEMATALTERNFPTKARTGRTWIKNARDQIAAAAQHAAEEAVAEAASDAQTGSVQRHEDTPRTELHAV